MSTAGVILQDGCSGSNESADTILTFTAKADDSISSLECADLVFEDEPSNDDDKVSFLGLPFRIWKKIFRYAGVICSCHIAILPLHTRKYFRLLGRSHEFGGALNKEAIDKRDLVTCALKRVPEYTDIQIPKHKGSFSMLQVSRKARFITLKALFQGSSFHFELRYMEDLQSFQQMLRGLKDMPPLNRDLRRLHVNLFIMAKHPESLDTWYSFCDYFGKHLKGSLEHFNLECRPKNIETAKGIRKNTAIHELKGVKSCNVLLDTLSTRDSILKRYAELSEQIERNVVAVPRKPRRFRFMDLPMEIQRIILQYALTYETDLYGTPRSSTWRTKIPAVPLRRPIPHNHSCCMCSMLKHQQITKFNAICSCCNKNSNGVLARLQKLQPPPEQEVSPLPIFLTSKYMHALGSAIFYSQNKFKFALSRRYNKSAMSLLSFCLPTRYIRQVRHLRLILDEFDDWPHDTSITLKFYRKLVACLRKQFELKSLDLEWRWEDYDDPNNAEVLSLFDEFEGERPENYRRAK